MSKKMLIVYFSFTGNTKKIADKLKNAVDADIAVIEPVRPYTGDYDSIVDQGHDEVDRGYEPEIKKIDADIADYDVIAVGTPTWWYTMAPVVHTFLDENDFTGKIVVTFMTNAGWHGTVISDMKKAVKSGTVSCAKEFLFDAQGKGQMKTPETELDDWIREVKKMLGSL